MAKLFLETKDPLPHQSTNCLKNTASRTSATSAEVQAPLISPGLSPFQLEALCIACHLSSEQQLKRKSQSYILGGVSNDFLDFLLR